MSCVLGGGSFGAFTYFAKEHDLDECNSHGLPLTPNTILITGLFQQLLNLSHSNLCQYLDLIKSDNERLICVSEYYQTSLETKLLQKTLFPHSSLVRLANELTSALDYLHHRSIIASFFSPECILFNSEGQAKLFNYGFYHMTNGGRSVEFPLESPRYLAPEAILVKYVGGGSVAMTTKSNIWSLGIILLEVFMECHIYPDLFLKNGLHTLFTCLIRLVQNHQRGGVTPLIALLDTHGFGDKPIDNLLKEFLDSCLQSLPSQRPAATELLSHPLFKSLQNNGTEQLKVIITFNGHLGTDGLVLCIYIEFSSLRDPFDSIYYDSNKFELPTSYTTVSLTDANRILSEDHLTSCSMKEVYFLWGLAGGDVQNELQKGGLIRKEPPILTLPCVVTKDNSELGVAQNVTHLYDSRVVMLPLDQLRDRLKSKTVEDYYPLIADPEEQKNNRQSVVNSSEQLLSLSKLPLLIKERDIDYQFHRMILYRRLLESYPLTKELLITEAIIDICPLVRGPVWAGLLNVEGDIQSRYRDIDKESETPTDRQIAVDIPRCHQYDFLLSSAEGHKKFMRLLKAWVVDHPNLVYWQGLDSLCAPFLSLNFNNEALAYTSLCSFIDKYLNNFFLKDNSVIMQEYLAVFSQMIAYHDPEIFNHLDTIGFYSDLYAIPWYLTMFTHVFPLHKIYHLWDTLLLGNTSFPIFAGVSILTQLRKELLNYSFNECIMMFSDLPDIDIHQCVTEAVRQYQTTPPSLCIRKHDVKKHVTCNKVPPEVDKEPLPFDVLRMECSPQISAHDFILLCGLQSHVICYDKLGPPTGKDPDNPLLWRQLKETNQNGPSKNVIILDIRSQEEYESGHVLNSLNLPHTEAFNADGTLVVSNVTTYIGEHIGDIIIIVAGKGDPASTVARQFVRLGIPYVCVLYGGAGLLRSLGLLSFL